MPDFSTTYLGLKLCSPLVPSASPLSRSLDNLKRMEDAGDDAPAEGVRIAQQLLRDMRGLVQGAYIIPAFGHYELAAEVIDALAVAPSR